MNLGECPVSGFHCGAHPTQGGVWGESTRSLKLKPNLRRLPTLSRQTQPSRSQIRGESPHKVHPEGTGKPPGTRNQWFIDRLSMVPSCVAGCRLLVTWLLTGYRVTDCLVATDCWLPGY